MISTNHHIKLFLLLGYCFLVSSWLYGQRQKDCLNKRCETSIAVGDMLHIFKYQLTLPIEYGDIKFKGRRYILDLKPKVRNPKIKIEFFNLPPELSFVFSRKVSPKSSFLKVPWRCKDINLKKSPTLSISVPLNLEANPANGSIWLGGTTEKNINCNDISFAKVLKFVFKLAEEESEDTPLIANTPKTVNPPTKEENKPTPPVVNTPPKEKDPTIKIELESVDPTISDTLNAGNNDIAKTQAPVTQEKEAKSNPPPKSRVNPTPPSTQRPQEDQDWEAAVKIGTLAAYEEFKGKYQKSKKYGYRCDRAIALRKGLEIEYPIVETGNGFKLTLKNTFDITVELFDVIGDSIQYSNAKMNLKKSKDFTFLLDVFNIKVDKNVEVRISDRIKPDSVNYIKTRLGNHLIPDPLFNIDSTEVIKFDFQKGEPPYIVYIYNKGNTKRIVLHRDSTTWTPGSDYFKDNKFFGRVDFKFSDNLISAPYSSPNWYINVPKEKDFLSIILGGLAFLLLIAVFIYPKIRQSNRKRNRKRYVEERYQSLKSLLEEKQAQNASLMSDELEEIEEGGNEFAGNNPVLPLKPSKSGIKITKIKKAAARLPKLQDEKVLEKLLETQLAFEFDTSIFWNDTMVTSILFTQKSMENLDQFLQEENLVPLKEKEGQIPEIGGILLGRPFFSKKAGKYRVLVEEFVPIAPEYHDTYQLEFSAQSLAKDLGDIQDQFSELLLVGWFHTHPGHGLFLSKPDLRIHDSFFKELYQFAMEIDSLSSRLDTGFFTRMKNGKVNNRRNLKRNTPWYSWIEAEKNV